MDKIFLKFEPNDDMEQVRAMIENAVSLRPMYAINWDDFLLYQGFNFHVCLETEDGAMISSEIIEYFKVSPLIASVSYLYHNETGKLAGVTDSFIVQLTNAGSYAKLQELAERYNCKMGERFQYDLPNTYTIHVPKSSELNVMQVANLFYETGLFVHTSPSFATFDMLDNY
jgi:hypothetical protein